MSSHVDDFNTRNKVLTARLRRQVYRYHKLPFQNCIGGIFTLKKLLPQGLSEPEFYGDLVYRFRKIIGKYNFPYHFKKMIVRYKKIGKT